MDIDLTKYPKGSKIIFDANGVAIGVEIPGPTKEQVEEMAKKYSSSPKKNMKKIRLTTGGDNLVANKTRKEKKKK